MPLQPSVSASSHFSPQPDPAAIVGPLLRWVDETSATVWMETSAACEVAVLGRSQPTFSVLGHHYGLVAITGLEPGTRYPYEVRLDGRLAWPPSGSDRPVSVIATRSTNEELRLAFGSCRVAGPRDMPLGIDRLLRRYDPDLDALAAFAERLRYLDHAEWPHMLLLMGDQVYADDVPRATRRAMRKRRGGNVPESRSVSDFEDYTQLYRDSWTEPALRWLYSTLPSAMIFDDHELVDDWDTSAAWVAEKRATPGWDARLTGALMSYWIYQHLGNLSPDELATDRLYQGMLTDGDGTERLRTHVREYDRDHTGSRWAFRRDFGDVRLLVLDTRATRVLEEGQRDMLDPAEWRWLEDNISGARHLLIASSVPVIYALGFHHVQAWSERVAAGAWGARAARFAEHARRTLSLSGWPSFAASFSRLMELLAALGAGRLGVPPQSITLLSGDVHHGYVARLRWPPREGVRSTVHQVVTSPFRNPLMPHERLAQRLAAWTLGGHVLGLLARSAGVPRVDLRWRRLEGIDFANQISTLRLDEGGVELHTEAAGHSAGAGRAAGGTAGRLRTLWRRRLA
jgi:phosphodiesterase/alkaline phosphatase D-like protein